MLDWIRECIDVKERLIASRLKRRLTHLGKEERVILLGKDYSRELEDIFMGEPLQMRKDLLPENYMSVNDQI